MTVAGHRGFRRSVSPLSPRHHLDRSAPLLPIGAATASWRSRRGSPQQKLVTGGRSGHGCSQRPCQSVLLLSVVADNPPPLPFGAAVAGRRRRRQSVPPLPIGAAIAGPPPAGTATSTRRG
ncbi:hypothetical protein VSH64_05760 [Amycolatopsis rhabdoformis]|uniref:Uncharacterized protein n=1 Tax=Amycolatopsis rhabdoformis TaxID=1448059 RepID=A0ABZ1ID94_9PSEU|nr:hypothetical protein [Amycolatopsis rhabdoformis]WSE31613.1 hypothetical protein VSH64_05760 [Amycolatopsis rhabdoformis]